MEADNYKAMLTRLGIWTSYWLLGYVWPLKHHKFWKDFINLLFKNDPPKSMMEMGWMGNKIKSRRSVKELANIRRW